MSEPVEIDWERFFWPLVGAIVVGELLSEGLIWVIKFIAAKVSAQ